MILKKLIMASAVVAAFAGVVATGALAADISATYNPDTGYVTITGCPEGDYDKTLLILDTAEDGSLLTTVTDADIEQIDQKAEGYTDVIVGDLEAGTYEVRIGGDGTVSSCTFTVSGDNPYYVDGTRILGDVNNSKDLSSADAIAVRQYKSSGEPETDKDKLQSMDMNDSGDISSADATAILSAIASGEENKTIADKKKFVTVE